MKHCFFNQVSAKDEDTAATVGIFSGGGACLFTMLNGIAYKFSPLAVIVMTIAVTSAVGFAAYAGTRSCSPTVNLADLEEGIAHNSSPAP